MKENGESDPVNHRKQGTVASVKASCGQIITLRRPIRSLSQPPAMIARSPARLMPNSANREMVADSLSVFCP